MVEEVDLESESGDESSGLGIIEARAVIGAPGDYQTQGVVVVYYRTGDGLWNEEASIAAPKKVNLFGQTVALSGNALLIAGEIGFVGLVYSYRQSSNNPGTWKLQETIAPASNAKIFNFGDYAIICSILFSYS